MGYTNHMKNIPKAANSLQEECVRVPKVYDWVTDTLSTSKTIYFTEDQKRKIEKTMEDPSCRPLRIVCETPDIPPLFSLKRHDEHEGWGKDFLCEQVGEKRDVTVPLNGDFVDAQVVDLLFTADVKVKVVDRHGYEVAAMKCNTSIFESFVLCYPDGTELMCDITKVLCRIPSGTVLLNGPCPSWFTLEVNFCVDIQVEAEVKLELLAKFCSPRETIEPPEQEFEQQCPAPEFPPQCPDIFPQPGCDCTAEGDASGHTGDECTDTGEASLLADICPNCSLTGSRLQFAYKDTEGEDGWKDFDFTATDFDSDSLECEKCYGGLKFTVSGKGETDEGDEYDFKLAIVDSKYGDQFQIELTESNDWHHHHRHHRRHHHHRHFDSGVVDVTEGELHVEDCVNFSDVKYKRN